MGKSSGMVAALWRAGLGGALVVVLAGCWEMPGQGPDRRAHNPFEKTISSDNVATLKVAWSVDTGPTRVSDPVVSDGAVYVTTSDVALHSYRASDGVSRWTAPFDRVQVSDAYVRDDHVIVGYGYPNLGGNWDTVAVDVETGAVVDDLGPTFPVSARFPTLVGSNYGSVSAGFCSSGISAINLDDSTAGWSGFTDIESGFGCTGGSATVGAPGIYHSGVGPLSTVPGDPGFGGGVRMYTIARPSDCAPFGSGVYVPCPTWAVAIPGATAAVIGDDDTIYVGSSPGTLIALDRTNGTILWTSDVGSAVVAPPALADGTLFVPTASGTLAAVAADGCGGPTCLPFWKSSRVRTDGAHSVQPAVAGGVVFTGSVNGILAAYSAKGCEQPRCGALLRVDTGAAISGAPAVTGGTVYIGAVDGRLIALRPSAT